ncbi:VOC family protein [Actinomadura madurae]|uniref:Glyoxalase/Bleomycin resistance protein/Dioxygenase superfamily protein n=1 Tax=Actinomadura madurae TaxID=1993 RepID=A0A1I5GM91_9ACTN|nr:VOC family protein [Actinomadura madurae]SFO37184.1 Glyoxalase/Bleomycin resistance protein/Dioxygenase superfamily protein [Actinomadura madurae]SPT51405.1 Manganese-dependent 2,3-dihydroxybiphenyl 1,2-dioxygenase [Actinomadura madurae]
MSLHGLSSITVGVPNLTETRRYYTEFGLAPEPDGWLSTRDGGRQLRLVRTPTRRLAEVVIGADHPDDLDAAAARLGELGIPVSRGRGSITALEPVAGFRATVRVTGRIVQTGQPPTPYNGPGRIERADGRAPGVLRDTPVRPRKLGHVVLGSTDYATTRRFFADGLGFRTSDEIAGRGAFLRCSTDHHNVLVLDAPVDFLHHSSWQVDDIDEIGRGAAAMLEGDPERHVWGLGRHHAGSNFFWYLKDPAGNFSEYYSDMDCVVTDELWRPETLEGAKGLFSWGPPPPPSFLHPEDLAALMTGAHQAR